MVNDDGRPITLPDSQVTIGDLARSAGYRTAYIGKWHLGRERVPQHGFEEWWTHLRGSYEQELDESGSMRLDSGKDRLAQRGDVPFELAHDTQVANRVIEFIRQSVGAGDGQFFCVSSMRAPHDPYIGPFDDLYDRKDIPIPVSVSESFDGKPASQLRGPQRRWFEDWIGTEGGSEAEERLADVIARYWGLVHLVDINVGRILATLEELGVAESTVVVCLSDHGEMMGAHGLFAKGLFMYQEATRVPLIVRWPGHVPAGKRVSALTSMIDVVPTVLDLMGVPQTVSMRGESMRQLWDYGYNKRSAVFMEVFESYGFWGPIFAVRTERYQYNWYLGDDDELYDIVSDPFEMVNLAGKPEFRDTIIGLRAQVRTWLAETGDPSIGSLLDFLPGTKVDGGL
jgi:arylsulfatase A-like enzyme